MLHAVSSSAFKFVMIVIEIPISVSIRKKRRGTSGDAKAEEKHSAMRSPQEHTQSCNFGVLVKTSKNSI